jgi:hypothetical protein
MSSRPIAALVDPDGASAHRVISHSVGPLRRRGIPLAGVIELDPADGADPQPKNLLFKNLATGEITATAELDIVLVNEVALAVTESLHADSPCLLVIDTFGKIEAAGGGMCRAIRGAIDLGIPVLVGVPPANLARWRSFAGALAVEMPAEPRAIAEWLEAQGLAATAPVGTAQRLATTESVP